MIVGAMIFCFLMCVLSWSAFYCTFKQGQIIQKEVKPLIKRLESV